MDRDEVDARARFTERYRLPREALHREIERQVIGGDFGANGYTTASQADELARLLDLARDRLLLDIGAGRGWPGLYLAATTGCAVVSTDLPEEGLRAARARADRDRIEGHEVVATAARLPFRAATFDAVVHTDVVC